MTRFVIFTVILFVVIINLACLYAILPDDANCNNVKLTGYVHEKATGKASGNCSIAIFNCTLKANKLYADDDILLTYTDKNGYYEVTVEKSHQMYIRAFKPGYAIAHSGVINTQIKTESNFMLYKGHANRKDFLKEEKVSEIIN